MLEILSSAWSWLGSVSLQLVALATGSYAIVQAVKLFSVTRITIAPAAYVEGKGEMPLDLQYLEKDLRSAFTEAKSHSFYGQADGKPLLALKVSIKRFGASNLKVRSIALIDAWKREVESTADLGIKPFEIELGIEFSHLFTADSIANHKTAYCLSGEYPNLRVRIDNRMGRRILSVTIFKASDVKLLLETFDSVSENFSTQQGR